MITLGVFLSRKWPLLVGRRRGYRVLDRIVRMIAGGKLRGLQWIDHHGIETQYDCDNYHERLMAYELHGEEGFAFIPLLLRSGDTFLDVGANAGMHSASAAGIVGRAGRVISIEANPYLVARLEQATVRNRQHAPHWTILDRAISDTDDVTVEFFLSEFPSWSSLAPLAAEDKPQETIRVPTIRLDSLAASLGKVRLMKIDIEGAESIAFRGAAQFFASDNSPDYIIAECNGRLLQRCGSSASEMVELLCRFGYIPHEMFWQSRLRPGARPLKHTPSDKDHIDLLFVHPNAKQDPSFRPSP